MKFIYASDIHGDMRKYNKLIELCKLNNTDLLVLGGDLLTKTFGDDREQLQREFIANGLKDYCNKLRDNKIRVVSILGNDDMEIIEKEYYKLISSYPNIFDVDNKRVDIDGYNFIGLNKVLDAPFKRKDHVVIEEGMEMPKQNHDQIYVDKCRRIITVDEWRKERLKRDKMIDCLKRLPEGDENTIYILHDPPANVGLDVCRDGDKAGSNDIYKFLNDSKAIMSLHGHIHESYNKSGIWKVDLNGTTAVQAGQTEYGDDLLYYVIVDFDRRDLVRKEIKV